MESTSVMDILNYKTRSATSFDSVKSDESQGFGQVYPYTKEGAGIVSVVPLISERQLVEAKLLSYDCSLDFKMKEMLWVNCPVLVKHLNSEFEVRERAIMIMNEAEKCGKLRHPNILLLMALCQRKTLDMMTLVFEYAEQQNLYHVLHINATQLSNAIQMKITSQLCYVLEFIHNQGFIHCGLSSKAVYLTTYYEVKLGNFEFMMESSEAEKGVTSIVSTYPPAIWLYSWMAPEVMMGSPPSFSSDVYSYSCIIWELFKATVPWSWLNAEEIYFNVEQGKNVALNVSDLPRSLHFLRHSLKLRNEERQGQISSVSYLLKSLELSFGPIDMTQNAADDVFNSPCSHKRLDKAQITKQDNLVFDSSQLYAQGMQKDQCKGKSYTYRREKHSSKQFVKPASNIDDPFMEMELGKTCSSDVKLKRRKKSEISEIHNSLREMPSLSVKELAKYYQQYISQHKLRQAILKGSTVPHGSCPELDSHSSSVKWHSLPATLEDMSFNIDASKNWTTDIDESGKFVSELGDISSTPKLKSCSTPERSDHPESQNWERFPHLRSKRARELRDIGVGCLQNRQKKHNEGQIAPENDKSVHTDFVDEIKLLQSSFGSIPFNVKDSHFQSRYMIPKCCQVDVSGPSTVTEYKSIPGERLLVTDDFRKKPQELTETETCRSNRSSDLTNVTQLEGTQFIEFLQKHFQDRTTDGELPEFSNESRQSSNINQCKAEDDKEIFNCTFTIEDENTVSSETETGDVDSVSLWVDSKLEDIRRRVMNKKMLKTENDGNSLLDFDEERSKGPNQEFDLKLTAGKGYPLNVTDPDMVNDIEIESGKASVCEFEFQEFYIDDDLNNDVKDHLEGPHLKEHLNMHIQTDLYSSNQLNQTGPPVFSIDLKNETDSDEVHHRPPQPALKPKVKKRGVRWQENLSLSDITAQGKVSPDLLSAETENESSGQMILSSSIEHKCTIKGSKDTTADVPHADLNLDRMVSPELPEKQPSLTQNVISLSEEKDSRDKIPEKSEERGDLYTFHYFDGNDKGHSRHNLKCNAEAGTWTEIEEVIKPSRVSKLQHLPSKTIQGLFIDQSTQIDAGNENAMFQRHKNQEIQVAIDCDSVDSDEWVNKKLCIIQDKIKRRKHRLVYCVSSDEEDIEDRQSELNRESPPAARVYNVGLNESEEYESSSDLHPNRHSLMQQANSHPKTIDKASIEISEADSEAASFFSKKHCIKESSHLGCFSSEKMKSHQMENIIGTMLPKYQEQGTEFRMEKCYDIQCAPKKPPRINRSYSKKSILHDRAFPDLNRNNDLKNEKEKELNRKVVSLDSFCNSSPVEYDLNGRQEISRKSTSLSTHQSTYQGSTETETTIINNVPPTQSNSIDKYASKLSLKSSEHKQKDQKSQFAYTALPKQQAFSDSRVSTYRSLRRNKDLETQYVSATPKHSTTYSDTITSSSNKKETYDFDFLQEKNHISTSDYEQENDCHDHNNEHCLVLNLGSHQDSKFSDRDLCQPSGNRKKKTETRVHKFYLPKDRWSNGCHARLHVELSPTNPRKHHVTTTATDPQSGCTEILLEETVETKNLRSSFNLQ